MYYQPKYIFDNNNLLISNYYICSIYMEEEQVELFLQKHIAPYLIVKNAEQAIKFYQELFDAKELFRLEGNGKIHHAELAIKNTVVMLADEMPEWGMKATTNPACNPVSLGLYVDDVDKTIEKARNMGAIIENPPKTEYYGLRMSSIIDPYGIRWGISKRVKKVSNEETKQMHQQLIKQMNQMNQMNESQQGGYDYKKYIKYKKKYLSLKNINQ